MFVSCRRTCVETEYDMREAVCCNARLYHGVGLSCCGKKAFNPAEATCCKVEDGYTVTGKDCTFVTIKTKEYWLCDLKKKKNF